MQILQCVWVFGLSFCSTPECASRVNISLGIVLFCVRLFLDRLLFLIESHSSSECNQTNILFMFMVVDFFFALSFTLSLSLPFSVLLHWIISVGVSWWRILFRRTTVTHLFAKIVIWKLRKSIQFGRIKRHERRSRSEWHRKLYAYWRNVSWPIGGRWPI